MKKLFSLIVSIALIISLTAPFSIHGFAEESGIVLPEFDYPTSSYSTFAETGIPYDKIISCFPEKLEIKYENGAIYVRDIGGDNAYFLDYLNYDGYDGVLADGYWKFEVSEEVYNAGGNLSMYTDSRSWHAQYDLSGERGVITLSTYYGRYSRTVLLYPTEGYGEQYVQVNYDLPAGFMVSDTYEAGSLIRQNIDIRENDTTFYAKYDAEGKLKYIDVSNYDTGEDASYLPGKGWSESSGEYLPTKAPTGFENLTLEDMLAMGPTDIGCEHQLSEALCDVPPSCTRCKREKGEPLGHSWVSGSEYDTCSACNGILYRIQGLEMPSFEGRPHLELTEAGVNSDSILSKLIKKLNTKYENGVFMIPNIDGYSVEARTPDDFFGHKTVQGWNLIEIDEEDLKELKITFFGVFDVGQKHYDYTFIYKHDGTLITADLYEKKSGKSVTVKPENNIIRLTYPKDKESKINYIDIYENGTLTGQTIFDREKYIEVRYNSDLGVEKVVVTVDWENLYFIPGKGWFSDEECTKPIDAPTGYEDKDAKYFAENYPHNIDFCIHNWKEAEGAKECTKCGERIAATTSPIGLIVGIAAGVILLAAAVAVSIILIKKKKSAKTE